ncbi:RAD55 family ATPase [Natronococcus occultus]|uniref:RecA-superfamily ATPase possibly involved in signal transduction n=1 Tax=Natronococcus occultus SP4 TaxID=694430 RepID=L0JYK8_9EURY|nr:RecA superfamily ATPase [Natronococcus occultus]AGB37380.1 RecA-superfamily ATPase possibly involved in signal transduction [Natronococcus occultus SP4]
MADRLRTGIDVLDRKLGGGLPTGSLVAYTATPASQSELPLYELTAARETRYLSTERPARAVRDALERSPAAVGDPRIDVLDDLEDATRAVDGLSDRAFLIVDPIDRLERNDVDAYVDFLATLKRRLLETDGAAVVHCLRGDAPANRTRTLHAADAVFELYTERAGGRLETTLTVPKFRDGGQPTGAITLELTGAVEIDTSRDIA